MRRISALVGTVLAVAAFIARDRSHPASPAETPILILADSGGFGLYIAEILKAEGFNEFQIQPPSDSSITASHLNKFDVVILAETTLTATHADILTHYVQERGDLISFRPDKYLASLFGIADAGGAILVFS